MGASSSALVSVEPATALARRLRLHRPLAFVDLETTGLSCDSDRIVEIAVVIVLPDGRTTRWERLVHPGCQIPAEATSVHGLDDDDVRTQPPFAALATELAALLDGCDFAGFNIARFDLRLLAAEFARAGVALDWSSARVVDAMAIYHRKERRDLETALRFYCERALSGGHRAAADVDATIDVLAAQLDRYDDLPRELEALANYCEERQPDWLTSDGKIAWRDGAARLTFGKHAGKSLQTLAAEEPSYLRWMLERSFPADCKRIVERALCASFPEAPQT